jgi:hypothetical protein
MLDNQLTAKHYERLARKVREIADPLIRTVPGRDDTERRLMLALVGARLLYAASDQPEELLTMIANNCRPLVASELLS